MSWKDMGLMSDQKTKRNVDSMDAKWNFADLRFLKSKKTLGPREQTERHWKEPSAAYLAGVAAASSETAAAGLPR